MTELAGLLEFRTGDDIERYTTRSEDMLYDGHIWYASPFKPGKVSQSPEESRNELKIEFPLGHTFAMQFLGYGPDQITTVTLRRNNLVDDTQFNVFWKGQVSDCSATEDVVTLICQSATTSAVNSGLIARTQKFCRHVLYNRGCNVDKADHEYTTTITAIDASLTILTCPELALFPENFFGGGMLTMPDGALRYITYSNGEELRLWRPVPEIAAVIPEVPSVIVYPGCDGSLNSCNGKFNNLDNNGGFYWIPGINPYGGTSVY
jgi:uncharacterized phage protein (TIGR02218 family)